MSHYAGYQEKLKRRLEAVLPKPDERDEQRKAVTTVLEKLTAYLKGFQKDNPIGVTDLEQVGALAEGSSVFTVPSGDAFLMIRPVHRCVLSDPEPPMGQVTPTAFVRRQSMDVNSWREFTSVVPPGNKHHILAEKVCPQLFQLIEKALDYHSKIDGTFPKLTFNWREVPKEDSTKLLPARKVLEIIYRPTGKVMVTVNFFVCLEVDDDGVKSYTLACNDNQWRLTFAFRERDLLSTADKSDSGCRLGCYTLVKALLSAQYPDLARRGRGQQIAKALLIREMHETSNASTKWRPEMYGDRFFGMLTKLSAALESGQLEHGYSKFMGGKANLLEGVANLGALRSDLEEKIQSSDSKLLPSIKPS